MTAPNGHWEQPLKQRQRHKCVLPDLTALVSAKAAHGRYWRCSCRKLYVCRDPAGATMPDEAPLGVWVRATWYARWRHWLAADPDARRMP